MRELLTDPDTEVQWIFMQRSLGAWLLREAAAAGMYSAVTYSLTIRSAWTFGPSERNVCRIRSTQPCGTPSASRS